jgi:hypothetical protein
MQYRGEKTAEEIVEQCEELRLEFGIGIDKFVVALLDFYKSEVFLTFVKYYETYIADPRRREVKDRTIEH